MNNINDKIRELNEKDGERFNKFLIKNLGDDEWCRIHKINNLNPNYEIAREKTYKDLFGEKHE